MEAQINVEYPDYPEGCPLDGSAPCDADVYLLCKEISDADDGFRSAAERGKYGNKTGDEKCMTLGLSVFRDIEACKGLRKKMPALGNRLVKASLQADRGRLRETITRTPGHHTWWPFPGQARSEGFETVHQF